ncbi:phage Gp37/Gp68 family protein [Microcoleus sp. N3A4]|uniref:phage Gp37/Gp68 family protein n=1 Tax=Microcoleus sp. N3A4 TaxID=3055379 RepID=UPI002FD72C6E
MSKTKIEWSDYSWNPLVGCSKISAGCSRCYAAEAAKSARLQQFSQYQKVKDWDGTIEFVENQLLKPLSWNSPKKVFVCSMSDIFHANVKDEWLDRIFAVMALASQHTFQILTKRPERLRPYLQQGAKQRIRRGAVDLGRSLNLTPERYEPYETCEFDWPLSNIWLGTSTENQKAADDRIPSLLQIPASVRFLSCEPLLESIDLRKYLGICSGCQSCEFQGGHRIGLSRLNLVIVGGESGTGARPCNIDSIRSLVQQCQQSETAVFVKQLGSNPIMTACYIDGVAATHQKLKLADRKGGDINEFPEDLQVREFPQYFS